MFQQKYYMVIMLVQVTTVRQLIERVKKGKFRSREDILAQRTYPTFFWREFIVCNLHQGNKRLKPTTTTLSLAHRKRL